MKESSNLSVISGNNEQRSIFKKCFENPMFSFVPFEVWRDLIVSNVDLEALSILCQTCHAFKEIVDFLGEKNNFNLALLFRREGDIVLARRYLLKCAKKNSNSIAMFHLGYGYFYNCGWGLAEEDKLPIWFKKSADFGNGVGMAFYASCLRNGFGVKLNKKLGKVWAKKALSSNNSLAVGFCHFWELGTEQDHEKAFSCFEDSAKKGDEFGQCVLAFCFSRGFGCERSIEKAFYWNLKAAEQGSCRGIQEVGNG